MVEQRPFKPWVAGSSPAAPTGHLALRLASDRLLIDPSSAFRRVPLSPSRTVVPLPGSRWGPPFTYRESRSQCPSSPQMRAPVASSAPRYTPVLGRSGPLRICGGPFASLETTAFKGKGLNKKAARNREKYRLACPAPESHEWCGAGDAIQRGIRLCRKIRRNLYSRIPDRL